MANQLVTFGLLGVGGYLLYRVMQGESINPFVSTGTSNTNTTATGTYGSGGSPVANVPALGTVVSTPSDMAAQAQAHLAYIIPDQTITSLQSLTPTGYNPIVTPDVGTIFLRTDVYSGVEQVVSSRINKITSQYAAAGMSAPVASIQNAGIVTMDTIKTVMSTQGLSGLNNNRYGMGIRGVFPITGGYGFGGGMGAIVTANPYAKPPSNQVQTTGWELAVKRNI